MKYGSRKVELDGHMFDSTREAQVYQQYRVLLEHGELKKLELQPKFLLQPSYKRDGKTVRAIYYQADFRLTYPDDSEEVVDVKSVATEKNPVYRLKRKMLLYKYPEIKFTELF